MRYRVDNVPSLLRPFWLGFSWMVAISFWIFLIILHTTCKIRIQNHIDFGGQRNFVYSLYVESALCIFSMPDAGKEKVMFR